jgi:NAD(P)-dependent dehydrogenase (short-subunit alcohol dehydrogenase family)
MQRFKGKTVIVTGASSGIGKTAALAFAAEGANVALAARREAEGERVAEEITAAGGNALFIKTDVSQSASVQALVDRTVATFGRLDCAFNNAGIGGDAMLPTADHSEANWDQVIAVNLTGTWLCMKHQIPAMLKSGGGAIVNNSSAYGLTASTVGHVPYAASKHGVIGLTKTAAVEYARNGLRVNAVCPGWTHSELVDPALEAFPEQLNTLIDQDVPMGRVADPMEIARAVLWLCSDEASFVTGHALSADGGWLAR